ncbi:hypothetical protein BCR37DRAFT_395716 [Protomyces lactucae-debilis]|uniref:Uncharacterized protein n=1 Tax=Protomyces lactucae-debilis TaxID=2754530 RepID=A0A1Y2ETH3_PROLT|nr:uncharacterized protein BCR37DRAFT_395716 [Protomyces lactucae-debilis]ORY74868.1 hypothetical protein BCR37DRAFT_395716 [Protomyces lactucae-debilis]
MNIQKYIPNDEPKSDHRTTAIPVKTVVLSVLFSVLAVFLFAMALLYCRNINRLRVEDKQHKHADFGQRQKVRRDFFGRPKPVPEDPALDLGELPAPYMLPQNTKNRESVDSLARIGEAEDGAYRIAAIRKSHEASASPPPADQLTGMHAPPGRAHRPQGRLTPSPLRHTAVSPEPLSQEVHYGHLHMPEASTQHYTDDGSAPYGSYYGQDAYGRQSDRHWQQSGGHGGVGEQPGWPTRGRMPDMPGGWHSGTYASRGR